MRYGGVGLLLGYILATSEGLRFTREPENQVAALSQPLWWHCQAEDDGIITYSWKQGSRYLPFRAGHLIHNNGTLYIDKVENDDVGTYTCIAEADGQILSSQVATLELAYINPTFSISPESQTAFLGDQVLLQCHIESLPPALITWTLDGQNVTKDTATMETGGESTLRIYPAMYPDAGSYKCEGRNPLMKVVIYSNVGVLVVEGPPVFTASLRSLAVPLGLTATFDCRFEGNPDPTVAWFIHRKHPGGSVSSQGITTSRKYTVYPNGTFEIHDVTDDDVAFYTCRVSNTFGEMSDSAHLNTSGYPTLPEFTLRPTDQRVIEGDNVTFICQAESNPDPTVAWMYKGEELNSVDGQLTLINVQPEDAGVYVCVVENGLGYKNVPATLTVLVGPSFLTKPEDLIVSQGSKVSLSCQADGNPTPNIRWTTPNSGSMTSSSSDQDGISVLADGSLVIGSVQRRHHGIYTCIATSEVGSASASAQLTVEASPVFTKLPVSYSVQVGERAMFHCQATGYPTPSLYWSKDDEGMISSTAQRQIYLNNSLVIHSVKPADDGVYRCHAFNSRGSLEAPATLTVIVPPSFSVRPTSQKARISDDVALDCVAIGDPVPTQKWNKDGGLLLLEDNMNLLQNYTLMITAIRPEQFGEYVCVASNMAGSISATARIQTEDIPILTIRPSSITVNISETARLQCKGEASETPTTHWFRLTGKGAIDVRINDRVTVNTDGEMVIQSLEPADEGWYQCVVTNSVGNVSENAFINVQVPPKITHTNSPQTTVADSDVTLTCQSTGDPDPVMHWINPTGQEIVASSSYIMLGHTLQIVSANEETDGGNWICKACNLLGCDESDIEVRIEGPPVITGINGTRTPTSVILNCFAYGLPEPHLTFHHKGQDVTLTLQDHRVIGNSLHIGQEFVMTSYKCVAENRRGQEEKLVSVPSGLNPPTLFTITSRQITMNWSAPVDVGGLPLRGYQIEATSVLGKTWLQFDHDATTSGSFSGLMPFTNYQTRIAGVNILGVGVFSDFSETFRTIADAPSPPTSVTVQVGDASIVISWNHSEYHNGNIDDIEYRYKISIVHSVQSQSKENMELSQNVDRNTTETVYQSGSISANHSLRVVVEGLTDSAVYTVTVLAMNLEVNKSSEPVTVFADLTVSASEPATFSPDTVIAIAFGVVGGIILILLIIFAVTQIRQKKKTQSMSLVNHRQSLDQFYMEDPKNLYGKKSKFSMKRSGSQGFYKFDNDESFHSAGSVNKLNGSALKEKPDDGGVLLTARNPLYAADLKDQASESSSINSPAPVAGETVSQSCEQAEIEIPESEYAENIFLKSAPDEKNVHGSSTGSDVTKTQNGGIDGHSFKADPENDIKEIYSISETDDSHVYEVPNLVSRNNSSRENSPSHSSKSSNPKSKPIRVMSLDQLRSSSQQNSHPRPYEKIPGSPLDSPTDERIGDPEREPFKVNDIQETSLGEDTDLLPHKKSEVKRDIILPKDIKISFDISEKDIKRDLGSAGLY